MAQVTVDARIIEKSLIRVLERVAAAIDWVEKRTGDVKLEVSEPYKHLVGPASRTQHCLAYPNPDVCGDVGILLGILDKNIKPSKAKERAKSRK